MIRKPNGRPVAQSGIAAALEALQSPFVADAPAPASPGEAALFVGRVTSRRPGTYAMVAFLCGLAVIPWALVMGASIDAASTLVLLLFSLPLAAVASRVGYDIAPNRTWQLTITSDHVTWDRAFASAAPDVVLSADIIRLSVARSDSDGGSVTRITLHLRDGSERDLPAMFTAPPNDVALVRAIQRAAPKVFTRHLS